MIGNVKTEKSEMIVLGIAGPSGSGKSTLVNNVAMLLDNSEKMHYEDYNPDYDKLTRDLRDLREGRSITYPTKNRKITPAKFNVIEEPTGRQRP